MGLTLNDTSSYHAGALESLGWELTVCNTLQSDDSVCRKVLEENKNFGSHLISFLSKHTDTCSLNRILEVGGGYGFLAESFLRAFPSWRMTMLDLSPYLLSRQKETLAGYNAEFSESDFFKCDREFLSQFEFAVFNENIGDFPTAVNFMMNENYYADSAGAEIKYLLNRYSITLPDYPVNINIGAIRAAEDVCAAGIKYVWFSEHSCEALPTGDLGGKIDISSSGWPERIKLAGHDEYTIKFSHIEAVAAFYGYKIIRGRYADFIKINSSYPPLNFILSGSVSPEHETIRQFIEDLYKYEFVVLIKE
jgi:hypothetical protein